MMIHPQFDPVALKLGPLTLGSLSLGPVSVRWYGLMYLIGFILFLVLGHYRIRAKSDAKLTTHQLDDLLFYGVLGVIIGGRFGYVLFYKLSDYLANPLSILKVWEGGMSFHGGFLGVLVAMWLFGRREGKSFFVVTDFIAPLVPLGLAAGRLGNFINGELWGRVTSPDAWWAMIFPGAAREDTAFAFANEAYIPMLEHLHGLPRHPSQLYEFALEGLALFIILWWYSSKPRPVGAVSAVFLIGYGSFRFIGEFAREPDSFLGFLNGFSMGQWLSMPMIIVGIFLFFRTHHHSLTSGTNP